jgi:ribosome biogenesis GTPase
LTWRISAGTSGLPRPSPRTPPTGSSPAAFLEHTHIYRVMLADGERLARVAGRLRHQAETRADFPAVGDWVSIPRPEGTPDPRCASALQPLRGAQRRPPQIGVAANIDTVFLVAGLDRDFNPRRLERYLLVAWESGATPVIVLNKADLVDDPSPFVDEVRGLAPAVPIHPMSSHEPESANILRQHLGVGRTGALLGSSGVGKSTIVNTLVGHERLRTREVREDDSRGRHTTTARQLVILPRTGILIDTPGMRELQLWETGDALAGTFADVEALAEGCRFRDCRHREEPGCAVRAAAAAGTLEAGRLESFQKLQDEQAHQAQMQDHRAQIEEKRKWKVLTKAANKRMKEKQSPSRLVRAQRQARSTRARARGRARRRTPQRAARSRLPRPLIRPFYSRRTSAA